MLGKINRRPAVNSDDAFASSPGQPVLPASSDAESENLRVTFERTTAELDKISPPPPGIERQYFDGALRPGVACQSHRDQAPLPCRKTDVVAVEFSSFHGSGPRHIHEFPVRDAARSKNFGDSQKSQFGAIALQ